MAGLDPAIHPLRKTFAKKMDTRVKPAYDASAASLAEPGEDCMRFILNPYISVTAAGYGGPNSNIAVERLMLDKLRQFIAEVVSPAAHGQQTFDDTGYRLAATALLVHVISLDGEPSAVEKRKLHSLLESRFKLDPGAGVITA